MKNLKSEYGEDVDWIQGGYLFPVYTEKLEGKLKEVLKIQKSFNLNIDWISHEKVKELVPGINSNNLKGGTYSPEDGSASPLKTIGAYYRLAKKSGVEFYFEENVTGFEITKNKINSVKTDKDIYSANVIINASGAFAREVSSLAGLDVPVYPDCHEAGITEPVKRFFEPMVVDVRSDGESANYYFYQNQEGQVVFCITPKPSISGTDTDNTSAFLPLVIRRMLELYPRLRNLRIRRTWRGLYPMTPDGFPIIGWTREIENMFLAVGMCGQGYMIGPGLGLILSDILTEKTGKYNFILEQLTLYREFKGMEVLK